MVPPLLSGKKVRSVPTLYDLPHKIIIVIGRKSSQKG
jgi:hypothetical protein